MQPPSPRLIDLHVDWLLQYAPETTVFEPALYPNIPARLPQVEGYLGATWAAILSCYRKADDWAARPDAWAALGDLITRIEAEFAGRLLIGPDDHARWVDDPNGLAWGIIGVEGFDATIRTSADLDRLPRLFERGVRLFQPVYSSSSVLGGSSAEGDDRGLTDLGVGFLETLAGLVDDPGGPRPLFDLAHLNPRAASEALAWFEADTDRSRRVIPVYSHGAPEPSGFVSQASDRPIGFVSQRAISRDNLKRLRALGGVIGISVSPPFVDSAEAIRGASESTAEIPFEGRAGVEGIAIGTDFLGVDRTLEGLGNVEDVVNWIQKTFDKETAFALIQGNGRRLIERMLGVEGG